MATECYEGDCPLHSHDEPIGLCGNSEEVRLLCEYKSKLKSRIADLEGQLAMVKNDTTSFDEMLEFKCHHCDSKVPYSREYVEVMHNHFKDNGMTWWLCPVCGCRIYFEEAYKQAMRAHKAPRVALP